MTARFTPITDAEQLQLVDQYLERIDGICACVASFPGKEQIQTTAQQARDALRGHANQKHILMIREFVRSVNEARNRLNGEIRRLSMNLSQAEGELIYYKDERMNRDQVLNELAGILQVKAGDLPGVLNAVIGLQQQIAALKEALVPLTNTLRVAPDDVPGMVKTVVYQQQKAKETETLLKQALSQSRALDLRLSNMEAEFSEDEATHREAAAIQWVQGVIRDLAKAGTATDYQEANHD